MFAHILKKNNNKEEGEDRPKVCVPSKTTVQPLQNHPNATHLTFDKYVNTALEDLRSVLPCALQTKTMRLSLQKRIRLNR